MMRLAGGVAAVVVLAALAGCARGPEQPAVTEPYLVVWAGDADRTDSDFLAVIDANPTSAAYGKVLRTIPVRSRGNDPCGLDGAMRADRRVFATGVASGRTFVFDLRDPLAGRLLHVDEPAPGRTVGGRRAARRTRGGHLRRPGGLSRRPPRAPPAGGRARRARRRRALSARGVGRPGTRLHADRCADGRGGRAGARAPRHHQPRARLRAHGGGGGDAGDQRAGLAPREPRPAAHGRARGGAARRGEPGAAHAGGLPPHA